MGKNWAISVGINVYDNLLPLKYAQRDAEAMAAWFKDEANFEQVFLFTKDSPPIRQANLPIPTQPTFARFQRFLDVQFERPLLKPEDNLWFFFAGHGRRYADQDYLMFLDSNPQAVERTAISVEYVTQRLRRCGADNVVLLIDACRDEDSRSGLGIGQQEHKGVITFYSCTANQQSWEIDELQHGSFTYTLLEGLRLQGEANCATVERLNQYLSYQVPRLNSRYKKPAQNPYLKTEPPYKMYFILLEQSATLKDAEPLKYQASQAENRGDFVLAKQLWIRVLAVSHGDLEAIEAIQRIAVKQTTERQYLTQEYEKKLERYQQEFLKAVQGSYPLAQYVRNGLKTFQQSLGLSDEDVERIEKPIVDQKEAETRKRKEEERIRQQQEAERERQQREEAERLRQQQEAENKLKVTEFVSDSHPTVEDKSPPLQLFKFKFEVVTVNIQRKWWGLGSEITLNRSHSEAQYFTEDLGNGVELDMVYIPGGQFLMGTEDEEIKRLVQKFNWDGFRREKPQHEVTVQSFFMGKYPITQAQWKAIASLPKVKLDLESDPSHFKGDDRPVERVSWDDAVEFCQRLSKLTGKKYRLPSEAEWEYACRAGTTTPFHFGETITTNLANYNGNYTYADEPEGEYRQQTTLVGSFPPNTFGLYDMHGQVWEWCEDDWHENYQDAPNDGIAWTSENSSKKVMRGGSWFNYPGFCRSAYRDFPTRDSRVNRFGIRVVRVAPRTTQPFALLPSCPLALGAKKIFYNTILLHKYYRARITNRGCF